MGVQVIAGGVIHVKNGFHQTKLEATKLMIQE